MAPFISRVITLTRLANRSREPESWEVKLIATLEDLFEQGVETLPELVSGLNAVRMHDQQGEPWSDASFRAFLQVNGY